MRLLGWMHNKIRHRSIEPFKDFTIGNYCTCLSAKSPLDEKVSHIRPRFVSRHEACDDALSEVEAKRAEGSYKDETSDAMPELFHGFLAIGTLGSNKANSEPATPSFPMSVENIAHEQLEVTENDLKLINDEIEKFIDAEEEGCNESLARSSYVSTITLSGMQSEGGNADDYGSTALYPLQGYLLGSSTELKETTVELKKEKASLGEMFGRTKIADENSTGTEGKGQMHAKQAHKSAKHLIRKILGKFHASRNPAPPSSNDAANSVSTKKKLNKVMRMLHRKVHPENSNEKEFNKSHKEHIKKNMHHNEDLVDWGEDCRNFLPGCKSMEGKQRDKNHLKLSQDGLSGSNSSGNGEYWIKTDADYLVLEL